MIFPEFENIDIINYIRKKYDPLADLKKGWIMEVKIEKICSEDIHEINPLREELHSFTYYLYWNEDNKVNSWWNTIAY